MIEVVSSKLAIAHVVSSLESEAAGPTYSVVRLSEELGVLGHSIEMHALEPRPERVLRVSASFYPRVSASGRLGVSPDMKRGLLAAARRVDVVHNHGLWMMPNVYAGKAARRADATLIVSPRGMMDPWALAWAKFRKRIFWLAAQRQAIDQADCLHATSDLEAAAIRTLGISKPIAVIPIGIDMPEANRVRDDSSQTGRMTLLYLGRLHPKKNVELLLRVWAGLQDRHKRWNLKIVGSGSDRYHSRLLQLRDHLGLQRVEFTGPVFGAEKKKAYQQANLYVLPTMSENFGITVAEALSYALPVVTTTGAPWSGLGSKQAGWCVDPEFEAFGAALDEALSLEAGELSQMGSRGREWMARDFNWSVVSRKTAILYGWLEGSEAKPDFVL